MPPARRQRQMSYCELTAQNEAEFVAAKSQPPRYPIFKSPTSNALFIRARPNNPYKRYVTGTCARTPRVRNRLSMLQQTQQNRFNQLTAALAQVDAATRNGSEQNPSLPDILDEIRNYRDNNGATIVRFEELCSAIEQLDLQGQTCMYLWFVRGQANQTGKLLTGRPIWNRLNKNWNRIDANAKTVLRERVDLTLKLVRVRNVQIDPVGRFESCDNLRVAAPVTDLFKADTLLGIDDFTPYADLAKLTPQPNGISACALSESVAVAGKESPFLTVTHWGPPATRQPNTTIANVIRPIYLGASFDVPAIRCFRFAAAYRLLDWPHG